MKYLKFLFLLIMLLILNQDATCQDKIIKLSGGKYDFKYQNKSYQNFQLEGILKKNKDAYKLYRHYKTTKKTARILGRTSLVMLLAAFAENSRQGIASFTTGIIFKLTSIGKKYRAIKTFNGETNLSPKIGKVPVEINVGIMTTGLGIRFSF